MTSRVGPLGPVVPRVRVPPGDGGRGGAAGEGVLVRAHGGRWAGGVRSGACPECRHDGGHEKTGDLVFPTHATLPLQRARSRLSPATLPPSQSPRSPPRSQFSRRRPRHALARHPTPPAPPRRPTPRARTRRGPHPPTSPQNDPSRTP